MPPVSHFRAFLGWLKEFLWFVLIFFYNLANLVVRPGPLRGRRRPIVIVADFFCSPLYYLPLRRALARAGFPVYLAKPGHIFRPLREQGRRLSRMLEDWKIEDGILLTHGAGGLAALSLSDASRQRIEHLISLGTPFHGTRLFLWTPYISALRDTAVGSDYLLINRMNALLFTSFTPFIAWQDEWIVPFTLARFGQGRDLVFDQVGRYNLVRSKENIATLVEYISDYYSEQPRPVPEPPGKTGKSSAKKSAKAKKKAQKSPARPARKR
ncbi:MAG: hypothetical protein HS115_20340 [Spirochaetales bacterium]|nr:hypothetical protein [Spirochaetales bacterium]